LRGSEFFKVWGRYFYSLSGFISGEVIRVGKSLKEFSGKFSKETAEAVISISEEINRKIVEEIRQ